MKSSDSCQYPEIENATDAPRIKLHVTGGVRVISATPRSCNCRVGHKGWRNCLRAPSVARAAVDKDATEDDHVNSASTASQTAPTNFRMV